MPKFEQELVFLPLGGSGEIGMNMNLFGIGPKHARKWLMVDCGVTFGGPDTPGIDLITPDPSYILRDIESGGGELVGLLLTHGHEDHIGATHLLWPELACPIYTTKFTAELVRRKFDEADILNPPINEIEMDSRFQIGPFDLEMVTLTHSIPEPNGVILHTEYGKVLHTGDWKIDKNPSLGPKIDSAKLENLGKDGCLAMICDSTNVLSPGESGSESDVKENLTRLISAQENRVFVTTFASNVGRLKSIIDAAIANDREICLLGRSMLRMVEVARATGILEESLKLVEPAEAGFIPRNKILYLCTGSQGEDRAALARIARDDHSDIAINKGDTIIFSSKIIPGNERGIFNLQNMLTDMGVRVITEKEEFIHVSGHPCRDELKQMYDWVKPEIAIPVHGEARHLDEHAIYAEELGAKTAISPRNGDLIHIAPNRPRILENVPSGRYYMDGMIFLPQGSGTVRTRSRLSYDGHIAVSVVLDHKHNLMAPPEMRMVGVPTQSNAGEDMQELIEDACDEAMLDMPRPKRKRDDEIERVLRRAIRRILDTRWRKKSDISVMVTRLD